MIHNLWEFLTVKTITYQTRQPHLGDISEMGDQKFHSKCCEL